MVTQGQVQNAFEAINKPCTIAEILQWLFDRKFIDIIPLSQKDHGYGRSRGQVSRMIQKLRGWKIVDRLPQGHTVNQMPIWYLVKNGDPHETPCKICRKRDLVYAKNLRHIMIRHYSRGVRISEGRDRVMVEDYQGGRDQHY